MPRNLLTLLLLSCLVGCQTNPPTGGQPTSSPNASQPTPNTNTPPLNGQLPQGNTPGSTPTGIPGGPDATPAPTSTGQPGGTTTGAVIASIKLSQDHLFINNPGEKQTFTVIATDATGHTVDAGQLQLEWTSDAPLDAKVDARGEVTGLGEFTNTRIRVRDIRSGLSATGFADVGGTFIGPSNGSSAIVIQAPTLTSFTPLLGTNGTVITLTGTRLNGTTAVSINGLPVASFTVINDSTVTAVVPVGVTSGTVTLTTPGGTATSTARFTAAPAIFSFTPAGGNTLFTTVTLTGLNFTGITALSFNGQAAFSFTVVNDTTITARPQEVATVGPIAITGPGGTATSATNFFPAPGLASRNLTQGPPGTSVILTGSNFTGATAVTFGGVAATSFTVNSNTQITVTVPAAAAQGLGQMAVTTPGGTTNTLGFTVTTPVVFVNANVVGGAGDGTSWANAYTSLQTALTNAAVGNEVWIATGTYKPAGPNGNRNTTFQLRSNINVFGGFNGTENAVGLRNPAVNVVNLSGDLNGNDNVVFSSGDPNRVENSFHVVTGANTMTLDGVTIRGGHIANGDAPAAGGRGAGMLNSSVSPTVNNVIFTNNVTFEGTGSGAGGGMANVISSPVLTNLTFTQNAAVLGGGMSNNAASPTMTNIVFSSNSASHGGGLFNSQSSPILTNAVFSSNTSTITGGGIRNEASSSPILTNVLLSGNTTTGNGGGMFNTATGTNPVLRQVTFFNNTAVQGGGIYNDNLVGTAPQLTITNSLLRSSPIHHLSTGNLTISFTSIEGGLAAITGGGTVVDGTNNDANIPVFTASGDPDGVDDRFFTNDDGFRLDVGANPAVDTGTALAAPATADILGTVRPTGGAFDRGAYERTP